MCLYEVPFSMSLLGFGMGTMLTNFHMCGIMLMLRAVGVCLQIFSQNCQFHHRRLESLDHFNVFIYIILSNTVSFLEDANFVTGAPPLKFFVYISIFSQVHFTYVLCV